MSSSGVADILERKRTELVFRVIFVAQTIPAINPVAAMITANVKVVAPGEEKYITVPIINPLNNGEITILNHPMISVTDVSSLNIFKNYNKKKKGM